MFLEGDWNIMSEMKNYPDMQGKWDVAVLPACPNPARGDGRATISNGLCYATSASNQNNETVLDFLRFLGSEEGQRIRVRAAPPSRPTSAWKTPGSPLSISSTTT